MGRWCAILTLVGCGLLGVTPPIAADTPAPLPPAVSPGQSWSTRPLVNDFTRFELSLASTFTRSVALEERRIGLRAIVDDARRWRDALDARARIRLADGYELGVAAAHESLHEGRPTLIPFGTIRVDQLVERRTVVDGSGEPRLRVSRQWTVRGARTMHHVLDVGVKPGTGSPRRFSQSELTTGTGATDWSAGYRVRRVYRRSSATAGVSRTWRGEARLVDDLQRTTRVFPGHETFVALEYLRDLRPSVTARLGVDGLFSEHGERDGAPVGARRLVRQGIGLVARLGARTDLDLDLRTPLFQSNVGESTTTSALLRWRF